MLHMRVGGEKLFASAIIFRRFFSSTSPETDRKCIVSKVVNVAIIGAPNSGKSTLINQIVERKVCAASNKVHTTTRLVRAMCVQDDTQIIFLDTPGVVTKKEQKKYDLPESMIKSYHRSLNIADVIGVVHDVANIHTKDALHSSVLSILKEANNAPSFLILNKVDLLKSKEQLLTIIQNLTNGVIAGNPIPTRRKRETDTKPDRKKRDRGYDKFSDVFMVSALEGDGVKAIKEYLVSNAKPSKQQYSESIWTDQTPEKLIEETVRAKFLDFLHQEIPYTLKTSLEFFEDNEEKIVTSLLVECPSERIAKLISGAGGGRLQQIRSHVRADLIDIFKKTVIVDIRLQAKPAS